MSLSTVLSVSVRPERASAYEAGVHRLAEKAQTLKERFEWAAYQVLVGRIGTIHFVSDAPDWATLAAREPVDLFVRRVLGEPEGVQLLEQLSACVLAERYVIGRDRLDLSHPPDPNAQHTSMGMVTLIRVRPGGEDACEELIRKVAQAIPLVSDLRRFVAYQTFVGDVRTYWIAGPLADLADLDRMLGPQELLHKAFGAEGALIYRNGLDAIERMERQITVLRLELSNASWLGSVTGRMAPRAAAAAYAVH